MQDKIKEIIQSALKNLGIKEDVDFAIEHPEDIKNGDYSSNVAMVLAKKLETNPKELAEKIVMTLRQAQGGFPEIQEIQVAGPGFINFHLSKEFFADSVKKITENGNFGASDIFSGRKFFIEHTQPNPFKEFHIGHLMNNAIGEAVVRLVKVCGGEVKAATYHGDKGLHVAKAVWYLLKHSGNFIVAYANGHKAYEEDESARKEIIEINKKIYDGTDSQINLLFEAGRESSFEYFESIYKKLDSHFDHHFLESEAGEIGQKLVLENLGKVFKESEGAVVFEGEKFGLHTRVFLNSEKLPTYEAKEVGLAKIKKDLFAYDQSITITANEQDAFFDVTEVAIGEVFPELKGKLKHLSHGMLRLPTGKMSSRTGDVITAESLINLLKEKVKGDERVAIGAIKYMILRQAVGGDIIFDIEKSVSTEGDSGVYLQYSYARANSILEKAKENKISAEVGLPQDWQVMEVERLLYRFPEVVLRAGEEFAPHYIASYLVELARAYNSFYGKEQIVNSEDPSSPYKVALSHAFATVMKNGLTVLGIPVLEKM